MLFELFCSWLLVWFACFFVFGIGFAVLAFMGIGALVQPSPLRQKLDSMIQ